MNKQQMNEMSSLRNKLFAAVAMLLVACIMAVSSTYAWFTLSTAPEIKGITTTVGANGNLEIALGTWDTVYGVATPGSAEGDSMDKDGQLVTAANITWGNLIDLMDESYGLGAIKLYPSRLNATKADGALGILTQAFSPLAFPKYGTDGRITELDRNTMIGKYNQTAGGFMALGTPNYAGVNAIGSASSMTEREFAVRNNKNAIESNRVKAKAEAQGAINLYSGDLAAIAIDNMSSGDDAVISADDVAVLKNLIVKLEASNAAIGDSIKSAIMLFLASSSSTLTDTAWKDAVSVLSSKSLEETVAHLQSLTGLATLPTAVSDLVGKYTSIKSDLAAAKAVLPESGDTTWGVVGDAVGTLLNASGILICNETIADIKNTKDSPEADTAFKRVTAAVLSGGLEFQFKSDSGIFADIAEMTGEYGATINFPEGLEVEGIPLGGLKKPVTVESGSLNTATGELGLMKQGVDGLAAPGADPNAEKALTDTYGYTIDMLFRTNASDSYLQLQTAAANRIYAGNNNEAIMGGGSNMTFTIEGEYTKAKIDGIAAGIRVVFYETTEAAGGAATILGVATLDTDNGVVSSNNYMLDLNLMDYSITNGIMQIGDVMVDDTDTVANEAVALKALSANTITKVTALVYLDGDVIDNGDIGVAGLLNGKLNLQFSSSATLTPMNNNSLMNAAN